jgi:hypothetical protein
MCSFFLTGLTGLLGFRTQRLEDAETQKYDEGPQDILSLTVSRTLSPWQAM